MSRAKFNRARTLAKRLLGQDNAAEKIAQEVPCSKRTALRHLKRVEREETDPGYSPPQWGGAREGAGRKPE